MYNEADIARFIERVDIKGSNDCWEWKGSRINRRYGGFWIKKTTYSAHRFSWEIHNGPIPQGMLICHTCDNTMCVNPNHLYVGTAADNNRDRIERSGVNFAKGEEAGQAKLTTEQVFEIKRLHEKGVKQKEIADMYKVSKATISLILSGKNWKHL